MFGKKKILRLDCLLNEIKSNSENNYKDAAQESYQEFWDTLEMMKKESKVSEKTYKYYETEGMKWSGKMKNYHHQNNVTSF